MKLTFLRYSTNGFLSKNKTARNSQAYAKSNTVGILFTIEDRAKHEVVKDLVKKLEGDGKKVKVLAFLPDKKENFEFMFDYFTNKDISFFGTLNSQDAINFCNLSFDYLYCLDEQPNPYILNLLARSKAHCRVGKFIEGYESYFELMLESKNGVKGLEEASLKYTRELR